MDPKIAALLDYYPPPVVDTIREFTKVYRRKGLGVLTAADWNRLGFSYGLVRGERVLDIGVGNGAMLGMLKRGGHHARITGVDIRPHSMLRLPKGVEFLERNITELDFEDGAFDTALCMEVIEHLPPEHVDTALAQLRRVAGKRLVMTVPYKEPYPLFHQNVRTGHKQSFDDEKLARLFPTATAVIVPRNSRFDWVMMVEDLDAPQSSFRMLEMDAFAEAFACQRPYALPRSKAQAAGKRAAGNGAGAATPPKPKPAAPPPPPVITRVTRKLRRLLTGAQGK